ncbi:hypothetical protein FOH38_02095 [Lysinibacillus fusiformis]|nr:hypothetical protein FOH38_02095 [Lysinibacillus fusiformis]
MNAKTINCPICNTVLTEENTARWDIPGTEKHNQIRFDSQGKAWCKTCMDEHDSIDWQEVYERQGAF